jgi:hypothetical protein
MIIHVKNTRSLKEVPVVVQKQQKCFYEAAPTPSDGLGKLSLLQNLKGRDSLGDLGVDGR